MKKTSALLLIAVMLFSFLQIQLLAVADESEIFIMKEDFEDGSCAIRSDAGANLSSNITDGGEGYGKVFQTSANSTNTWYVDIGKTFAKEDNNIAKISFDIKAPSVAANVLFFLGDSEHLTTIGYDKVNTSYRKKLMYFRNNLDFGVYKDSSGSANWPNAGALKEYVAGNWYHIDIITDMYKQTTTIKLDNTDWVTLSYSDSVFESFNIFGVKTEKASGALWQIDNFCVNDLTVEVDETVLFEADFEDVESAASTGISFDGGRGDSNDKIETGYGDKYNKVLRFDTTASEAAWVLVPVNATDMIGKTLSIGFDMYAGSGDSHECMVQLHNGTEYHKILVMNGSGARGKLGYYKFPDPDVKVWTPAGSQAVDEQKWVRADGIIEFRENQTILKWYFNGVYSGLTYSFDIKQIDKLRFRTERVTDTAVTTRRFALDNIIIRRYENKEFETKCELTEDGSGTKLSIIPKAMLAKNFDVSDVSFDIVDAQTGETADVASQIYSDGKIILTVNGLDYNKPYKVSSDNFTDLYGQKMRDFEFNANPQYDEDGNIIPAIFAVWLTDYDGNRLSIKDATTEVKEIKILFNTRMTASTMTGITLGNLTLDGSYNSRDNSYTATWNGYLEPETIYSLKATGLKDVNGTVMEDYVKAISTNKGRVRLKDVKILNSSGETATTADAAKGAVLTLKANLLNTGGTDEKCIVAYGMYKNLYMQDCNFEEFYAEADKLTPIIIEIPYEDSEADLKIFAWDEFGVLNPYFSETEFVLGE